MRGASPEEEGPAKTTWDELTATPISCPPALQWWEELENSSVKLSPRRIDRPGEGVLKIQLQF